MAHEFAAGTDSEYDECRDCGLLAEPLVTAWVTSPCAFLACTEQSHDAPCVMLADGQVTSCSYCDRVGGRCAELDDDDVDDFLGDDDPDLLVIELLY